MRINAAIRKRLTAQIVEAIETNNVLPWRRPWRRSPNTGRASNVASKKPYNGVNPLLLELHGLEHGLGSRWYGTFQQWEQLGCHVLKRPDHVEPGRWGARIVMYRPMTKRHVDAGTGDEMEDRFFVMRAWTVFNADQVDGADKWQTRDDGDFIGPDFAPADELIAATAADIRHHGDQAFYCRSGDYIAVPPQHRFDPLATYYETVLRELSHWSEPRLGWDSRQHGCAMGELVAEMAASFLSTELGVPQSLDNDAAHLNSWLREMWNDPAFIFRASTQASKVTDYLLSFVEEEAAIPEAVVV